MTFESKGIEINSQQLIISQITSNIRHLTNIQFNHQVAKPTKNISLIANYSIVRATNMYQASRT